VVSPNTLSDGVPKVTEALRAPFWHFWHPVTLRLSETHDHILNIEGTAIEGRALRSPRRQSYLRIFIITYILGYPKNRIALGENR
jgi:hypothetical protein